MYFKEKRRKKNILIYNAKGKKPQIQIPLLIIYFFFLLQEKKKKIFFLFKLALNLRFFFFFKKSLIKFIVYWHSNYFQG